MNELAHGKLFAVPLPDETFVCGRVMLDIYGCLKRRLFPADAGLPTLGRMHLVEMYSAVTLRPEYVPSDLLVAGALVESHSWDDDEPLIGNCWPLVGHRPVDPREVEFPECVIGHMHAHGDMDFECGEIRLPLPFKYGMQFTIGEFKSRHSSFLWPYTCLRLLGRESEVPADYKTASLAGTDLRYSKYRAMVYEHLPFPMEMSYFEKQKQLGLHLEKLYE